MPDQRELALLLTLSFFIVHEGIRSAWIMDVSDSGDTVRERAWGTAMENTR